MAGSRGGLTCMQARGALEAGPMGPGTFEVLHWMLVFLATLAVLLLATEVGFRLGKRARHPEPEHKSQTGVLIASVLALLGLLLAFSFSIVEARLLERKQLVLAEANAIGTAYLRADTLPAPMRTRVQSLLRQYVDVRLQATSPAELERTIRESDALHADLWAQVVAAARDAPQSVIVGLFSESAINEVFDLHESRVTVALHQRLPRPILWTLYVVSFLSMALLGYGSGLVRARLTVQTLALVLAVSSVILVIVELDRPGTRLFAVSQAAMRDTAKSMHAP